MTPTATDRLWQNRFTGTVDGWERLMEQDVEVEPDVPLPPVLWPPSSSKKSEIDPAIGKSYGAVWIRE